MDYKFIILLVNDNKLKRKKRKEYTTKVFSFRLYKDLKFPLRKRFYVITLRGE